MPDLIHHLKTSKRATEILETLKKTLPIIAFIPPLLVLYILFPASFETTWKGRTFYLFFIWLAFLEVILNWEKIQGVRLNRASTKRTAALAAVLLLPTIYVVVATQYGLNTAITSWASHVVLPSLVDWVSLSTEYLVFTALFALIISVSFGIGHLKDFALSTLFLGAIGVIYMIDNFYPGGNFTLFQLPVPVTTQLAANVLNLMGYTTKMSQVIDPTYGRVTYLAVTDPATQRVAGFGVAWPCAGIESLIIYTITILIFLKGSHFSWKQRAAYFSIGAVITYFINVLRIVTIFILGIDYGINSQQVNDFHYYYGQLYSITWIVSYPLIIIGSQILWSKIQSRRITNDLQVKTVRPTVAA
jgi:thaumarchaeosortase